MEETTVYIEIVLAPTSWSMGEIKWDVVTPDHKYNPALTYDELAVTCLYEWQDEEETKAYLSGGEVREVNIEYPPTQALDKITKFESTQGTKIAFNEELVSRVTTEVQNMFNKFTV